MLAMALLKTLHIACAVLWLGNFALTGVWSARAFRTRNSMLRIFAVREILFTDIIFTAVFGTAVTVTGIALANFESVAIWQTRWTALALGIVIASGGIWLAVLLPLELRMRAAAATGAASIGRLFLLWNIVGWIVTLALFGVIYLMVGKPA